MISEPAPWAWWPTLALRLSEGLGGAVWRSRDAVQEVRDLRRGRNHCVVASLNFIVVIDALGLRRALPSQSIHSDAVDVAAGYAVGQMLSE